MKEQLSLPVVVEMEKSSNPTREYTQVIENFGAFGRELKISPKANTIINKSGFKTTFFVPTVNVLIGIGNDYTADLIMTLDAWNAFKSGDDISITTVKQFKEKFL